MTQAPVRWRARQPVGAIVASPRLGRDRRVGRKWLRGLAVTPDSHDPLQSGTPIASAERVTPVFRITSRVQDGDHVLKLEGCLFGAWVPELAAWWRGATAEERRHVRVDLTDVCHVDAAGRALMTTMYRDGARFVARGCVMPELVREISESVGGPWRH